MEAAAEARPMSWVSCPALALESCYIRLIILRALTVRGGSILVVKHQLIDMNQGDPAGSCGNMQRSKTGKISSASPRKQVLNVEDDFTLVGCLAQEGREIGA